jgi:hypothetical protein
VLYTFSLETRTGLADVEVEDLDSGVESDSGVDLDSGVAPDSGVDLVEVEDGAVIGVEADIGLRGIGESTSLSDERLMALN